MRKQVQTTSPQFSAEDGHCARATTHTCLACWTKIVVRFAMTGQVSMRFRESATAATDCFRDRQERAAQATAGGKCSHYRLACVFVPEVCVRDWITPMEDTTLAQSESTFLTSDFLFCPHVNVPQLAGSQQRMSWSDPEILTIRPSYGLSGIPNDSFQSPDSVIPYDKKRWSFWVC